MNNTHSDWNEFGYWDAVFRYLKEPIQTNDQLYAVLEVKMEEYSERFEDPIEALEDVKRGLVLLEEGHLLTWTRMREELALLFVEDMDFEILFIEAAKTKGIQFELLVAHLS